MRDVNITHFLLARGLQQSYSLDMTNSNKTVTAETLTRARVRALRDEADGHGDRTLAQHCRIYLDGGSCTDSVLRIVDAINDAAAQR